MTAKEAHALLLAIQPGIKAVKCMEYETLFVFQIVPATYKADIPIKNAIDSLVSVNKTTKALRDFKPFHISLEEYKAGKEVGDYK